MEVEEYRYSESGFQYDEDGRNEAEKNRCCALSLHHRFPAFMSQKFRQGKQR
jgi:hypothetical protein